MLRPRALRPGDRVALVSPASPFAREEFDAGAAELRRLGFEPAYDDTVFARRGYVSGPPAARAEALHRAWADPTIAALVAVRGGYGSMQVLPLLDRAAATRAAKPLIGYSDITALLTFMTLGCGVVSFHGPMLEGRLARGDDGYDRASWLAALCRPEPMGELAPPALEVVKAGEVAGPLFGGTVTQLLASLGTPFAFAPPEGYVLFFDEVAERPYRLDRMVTQLAQSGLLRKAAAIVIGELPRCDEPGGEVTALGAITDALADFPGPVLAGFPSGHTVGPSWTLPLGVRCRVVAGPRPRLVIEEAAVQ